MAPDTAPTSVQIPIVVNPETGMIEPSPTPVGFQMMRLQTGGISIRWFTPSGMFQVFLHQEMAETFRNAVNETVGALTVVPSSLVVPGQSMPIPPRS